MIAFVYLRTLHILHCNYSAPDLREDGNKRCLCPSVCPTVAYIANNSRTQRPSVPKFGMKGPRLRCDSHQFQNQMVKGQGYRLAGAYCVS